ncbi:MAG: NADP-dependent oxidoreductase [Bdellovibrionota bacterium]
MKAVRIHKFGGPETIQIEEIPAPPTHPGEALIHVKAAAVNPVDWMIREQIYNPEGMSQVPMTLGQDFSGVIQRIERECSILRADEFEEGDEVVGETWGSFAEYVAVPLRDLVRKPRGVDFETAAAIPMPGLTAWQMVIKTAGARPGMRFLIHGASGGVGSFAVQFAKWKGAEVIATASSSSFDWLRSIGVDEVIDYRTQRFEEMARDVDVVIDPLGGDVQARSWPLIKKGGMLINLIGEIDEVAARKYDVRGILFGMEYNVKDLNMICSLVEQEVVNPHLVMVKPLEQAREALDMNQQGLSHGKIVLKVA